MNVQERTAALTNYTLALTANSNTTAERKLADLLPRCWETDPSKRINIFDIVEYLREAKQNMRTIVWPLNLGKCLFDYTSFAISCNYVFH